LPDEINRRHEEYLNSQGNTGATRNMSNDPDAKLIKRGAGEQGNIRAVERACSILKAFGPSDSSLRLEGIAVRCNLPKPTAYRLLKTLVACEMLDRPQKNLYRLATGQFRSKRYRFGYGAQSEEFTFSRLVSESIRSSAFSAGIELLTLNNRYSAKAAIRNAGIFVHEHVDFVIEFQTSDQAAEAVSARLREAGIPCLAIEVPHPDALYFGANNYRAGLMGGHALAQACLAQWGGHADAVLLLEQRAAGALPHSRLSGTIAGLRELLPHFPEQHVHLLDGRGRFEDSLNAVRRHLQRNASRQFLVSGVNDECCLGALSAFKEAGMAEHCLVVGQNATIDARQEMRRAGSRLVSSVGYFPEQYGEAVISIALRALHGEAPPPSTFVKHQLVSPANVDILYPNDSFSLKGGGDSLLYSIR
jgi:ribose transport system substrate-binding protein